MKKGTAILIALLAVALIGTIFSKSDRGSGVDSRSAPVVTVTASAAPAGVPETTSQPDPKATDSPIPSYPAETPVPIVTDMASPTDPPDRSMPESPEPTEEADDTRNTETSYVLNTNTKKFHYPSCSSVKDIKAENRKDVTNTRDEIIAQGYVPCKRCNP